jgi:hypothetical protein
MATSKAAFYIKKTSTSISSYSVIIYFCRLAPFGQAAAVTNQTHPHRQPAFYCAPDAATVPQQPPSGTDIPATDAIIDKLQQVHASTPSHFIVII